ncbi:unnamed protein product [Clonostachys solani]|uniref:Glycoside hydrolase family 76 protein n=1 Tax=Clonostachys solani TaxID=160281 RepID=A0A9N9Z4D3_9HYPO|nr:unnamed protein product [Clonostachys solani]
MYTYFMTATIVAGATLVGADASSYNQNAGDQLLRWFNSNTGLFYDNSNNPYWWQGGNMLTTLALFGKLDSGVASQVTPVINQIYTNAPKNKPFAFASTKKSSDMSAYEKVYIPSNKLAGRSPLLRRQGDVGFENSFYDDEAWWALGFIASWELTGKIEYLNEAIYIWDDMTAAVGTTPCGGIWWDKAHTYVNAIANELYLHLSAAIANNVGSDVKQKYVNAAINQWNWFKGTGMINSQNLINDGLDSNCRNNGHPTYTYNQGVILSGLAKLYKATGDSSYLDQASLIANAAISTLVDSNGILVDDCDKNKNCSGDGEQFKGVFTRGLRDLYNQRPTASWKTFIDRNAQSIWNNDLAIQNGGCFNGAYWGGPYATADASTQSCALDTIVAALAIN